MERTRLKVNQRIRLGSVLIGVLTFAFLIVPLVDEISVLDRLASAQAELARSRLSIEQIQSKLESMDTSTPLPNTSAMNAKQLGEVIEQFKISEDPRGSPVTHGYRERLRDYVNTNVVFGLLESLESHLRRAESAQAELENAEAILFWWQVKLIVLGVALSSISLKAVRRTMHRVFVTTFPSGYCRSCFYNLEGNQSGVCPECGTAVATKSPSPT